MDSGPLIGLISLGIFVIVAVILVARSRLLREKEYSSWLESYRASTAQPESDPNRLRELWVSDLRVREEARRAAAPAQSYAPVAVTGDASGVQYSTPVAGPQTNTLALLSFIFSLLGGLLGIVFGHIALSQIRRTGEGGRGLAIAGLVLGYAWLAGYAAFGISGIVYIVSR